jgi:glycogen debranching enzyme
MFSYSAGILLALVDSRMLSEIALRVYPGLLFAYHGRSLLITNTGGDIECELQGLYEHDARILSRYRLLVNGKSPRLDAISSIDPHSTLGYYVCPPTADSDDDKDALGLSTEEIDRQVVIRVARFVGQGMHEDVEVTNHGLERAKLELTWELGADFADLLEARGGTRQQEAAVSVPTPGVEAGGGRALSGGGRSSTLRRGEGHLYSGAWDAGELLVLCRGFPCVGW